MRRKRISSSRRPPTRRALPRRPPLAPPTQKTAHVEGVENELRQKLGLRIEIKVKGKDKGQIVLAFESNDDFERLLEVLRR